MKIFYNGLKLGILGGGQLGRMLIQEAISLNVFVAILDPDPQAPCSEIANSFKVGDINDFDTVLAFGRQCDVISIEIEHVNTAALKQLQAEGKKVFPQPDILEMIQDKGLQKQFYALNNIPTASFVLVDHKLELERLEVKYPIVQKLRKGGYDGKGVTILRDKFDLPSAFDAPSVVEQKIDFRKEVAIIVSRNEKGEKSAFPLVEMEFNSEANLVEFLYWPSEESEAIQQRAAELALDLAEKTGIVGLLAVEMFLTAENELLVNEIAPRTHNSGHHTIEAAATSQFMQHLRSVLGLAPGSTAITSAAAMINLLGEPLFSGEAVYQGLEEVLTWPGVYVHLYGKSKTKPFRKMGHITLTAASLPEVKLLAQKVKAKVKVIA
jgi:5-(carboxyamino)imidazole ribonucleotide synthase